MWCPCPQGVDSHLIRVLTAVGVPIPVPTQAGCLNLHVSPAPLVQSYLESEGCELDDPSRLCQSLWFLDSQNEVGDGLVV